MKKFLAALLLLSVAGGAAAQELFDCATANGREVRVTREGDALTYSYGRPGRPEITLRRRADDIYAGGEGYFSGLHSFQWGFPNGAYLYVVWAQSLPGEKRAEVDGGVDVYKGEKRVGKVVCRRVRTLFDDPAAQPSEAAQLPAFVERY